MTDAELLEANWGRPLAHESGHALAAVLQEIPCYGIYWNKSVKKFCTLSPLVSEYSRKDFLFLGAGSAAELLTYGSPYDEDAAKTDKIPFQRSGAPSFDEAVSEAQTLLLKNNRKLKRLVSMLKAKCLAANLNMANLPEHGMDGTTEKFGELMSEAELRQAVAKN